MKNLKKVLALVLAFACAFTMFAGALTFSDVKPGDDYSVAITMLSDLEVISGNGKGAYEPDKAITRAEACVLIANIMNGGKADTSRFAGGSNFSDVAKTYWGESAIAYCVQMGVTYGVGGGKFAPNRTITDAEFIAMVTRAMGYDTPTNPLKFPYGNYAAAVDNGLVDNVPYVEGSDCTKGEAAQVLYDCLFADYARYTATQNIVHNADDHDDEDKLIHVVFGLNRACDDAKKCEQHYWVIVGRDCDDEDVIYAYAIEDDDKTVVKSNKKPVIRSFECDADVSELIGYMVCLWGEDEHDKGGEDIDVIKAIEVIDDDQVAYEYNPTMDVEDDLDLDEDDVFKTAANVYGYKEGSIKLSDIEEKNGNSYVLIDWDGDGEIDYVKATERYYGEITSLSNRRVTVKIGGKSYALDREDGSAKFDCKDLYTGFCCNGDEKHDYEVVMDEDIEVDDIVEVTVSDAFEQTLTITLTKVESTTKEFTKWDSKQKVFFDDEKMEAATKDADDYVDLDVFNALKKGDVGTDYDIWTNANGYIIKMDVADGEDGYLMVLGVYDGTYSGTKSKREMATMDVMLSDGTVKEDVPVDFDADIYNDSTELYDDDTYEFQNHKKLVGWVFEYEMDDDGVITDMECAIKSTSREVYEFDEKYDEIKVNNNKTELTGDDFVFVVDEDYIDKKTNDVYRVDEDLVAVVAVEDLTDIDKDNYGKVTESTHDLYNVSVMMGEQYKKNQNNSTDYVDGAVMVVDNINRYLGSSEYVGLITYISYDKNEQYTLDMVVNGETEAAFKTVEVDKKKDLFTDGSVEISKDDAKLIEELESSEMKLNNKKNYAYGLYAYIEMNKDEEVDHIELLVEKETRNGVDYIVPKAIADVKNDYAMVRGVVTNVAKGDDNIRVATDVDVVVAKDDETLYGVDEYRDVEDYYDVAEGVKVYVDEEIPGLAKDTALNENIAFHKDSEFTVGDMSDVRDYYFSKDNDSDDLNVVDIIFSIDDNKADEVVAIYTFDHVESAEYAPALVADKDTVKFTAKTANSSQTITLSESPLNIAKPDLTNVKLEKSANWDNAISVSSDVASNGEFMIDTSAAVNAGTYTLTAKLDGFKSEEITIIVEKKKVEIAPIELKIDEQRVYATFKDMTAEEVAALFENATISGKLFMTVVENESGAKRYQEIGALKASDAQTNSGVTNWKIGEIISSARIPDGTKISDDESANTVKAKHITKIEITLKLDDVNYELVGNGVYSETDFD